MDDFWTAVRILDYLLFGGVLTGLLMHFRHLHIPDWPGFRFWLWGFVASVAYATAESMWRNVPGGPRLVVITVCLTGLFVGCWLEPARRFVFGHKEHDDGA